jgi:hypothetical protein
VRDTRHIGLEEAGVDLEVVCRIGLAVAGCIGLAEGRHIGREEAGIDLGAVRRIDLGVVRRIGVGVVRRIGLGVEGRIGRAGEEIVLVRRIDLVAGVCRTGQVEGDCTT